jgi:uncharacterized metal-binding protein
MKLTRTSHDIVCNTLVRSLLLAQICTDRPFAVALRESHPITNLLYVAESLR